MWTIVGLPYDIRDITLPPIFTFFFTQMHINFVMYGIMGRWTLRKINWFALNNSADFLDTLTGLFHYNQSHHDSDLFTIAPTRR